MGALCHEPNVVIMNILSGVGRAGAMWPPWIGARLDRCSRARASTRSDGTDRSQRRDFLSAEEGNDSEKKVAVDGKTAKKESTRAWPDQVNERRSCPWRARKMKQR